MEVRIERATEGDRARIFELLEQANMHRIPSPEMPEISFENYFVARVEGTVAGFCGYRVVTTTDAKTELMVVDRSRRGLGIGMKLQTRRMEDMLARGIRTVTTNADLDTTIAWYKKHFSYVEVGSLAKLHDFGDPEVSEWTTLRADLQAWDKKRKKDE